MLWKPDGFAIQAGAAGGGNFTERPLSRAYLHRPFLAGLWVWQSAVID